MAKKIDVVELSEGELEEAQGAGVFAGNPGRVKTGYLPDGDVGVAQKAGFLPTDASEGNI